MKAVITSMTVNLWAYSSSAVASSSTPIAPATMARIGTVDERFQSYNIETIEATGGRFWKPYSSIERWSLRPKLWVINVDDNFDDFFSTALRMWWFTSPNAVPIPPAGYNQVESWESVN